MTTEDLKANAKKLGISPAALKSRIARHGEEKAIAMGGPMDSTRAARMGARRSPWGNSYK